MNLTKSAQRVDETAEVGSKHDFEVRKLAVGCSKYCFEVVDELDEVSSTCR
ncbi:hypothetical protein [Streptococcus pneumoniae]|uniref:hypothetical protein n=1 Tax=Streptococcus pneumoniae TaxID=1313 RepID=UPI000B6E028B|nr:hypothetical protein [Streptococcus pneumoniae]SNI29773.1 chlorohydrolase [Streptococcus pneumoniae]